MPRLNCCVLLPTLIIANLYALHCKAAGLIYRLPADGAWVRYDFAERGYFTVTPATDTKPAARRQESKKVPIESAGFFALSSVGMEEYDGKKCRWIELEFSVSIRAKVSDAAVTPQEEERHLILKMLIPEASLTAGSDPLAHVQRLYRKDGDNDSELVVDERAKQYHLDRFRPLFPAPAKKSHKSPNQQVDTHLKEHGTLNCEEHTFDSTYEGPLVEGRRGWWSWRAKHSVHTSPELPFGVAALTWDGESHEWSGDQKRSPRVTVKSVKKLIVAETGTGARSSLRTLRDKDSVGSTEIGKPDGVRQFLISADPDDAVARIQRLLTSAPNETPADADLRRIALLVTLKNTKVLSRKDARRLASTVNAALDDERVKNDLESAASAANVAGTLRLTDCIETLVRRITLPPPTRHGGTPIRSTSYSFGTPAMAALVSIGEPAIPAITELADSKDASEIERLAARRVIQQINLGKANPGKQGELNK